MQFPAPVGIPLYCIVLYCIVLYSLLSASNRCEHTEIEKSTHTQIST